MQKVWSPEARNPFLVLWGLEIPKRTRPRVLLGPVRKDKKTIDLVDSKSASVRALTKRDCNRELAEGELASCPRGLPARKRPHAASKNDISKKESLTRK